MGHFSRLLRRGHLFLFPPPQGCLICSSSVSCAGGIHHSYMGTTTTTTTTITTTNPLEVLRQRSLCRVGNSSPLATRRHTMTGTGQHTTSRSTPLPSPSPILPRQLSGKFNSTKSKSPAAPVTSPRPPPHPWHHHPFNHTIWCIQGRILNKDEFEEESSRKFEGLSVEAATRVGRLGPYSAPPNLALAALGTGLFAFLQGRIAETCRNVYPVVR